MQVIKISFEMSEKRRVELENMSERNRELEGAYNTEREKWKALQKVTKLRKQVTVNDAVSFRVHQSTGWQCMNSKRVACHAGA